MRHQFSLLAWVVTAELSKILTSQALHSDSEWVGPRNLLFMDCFGNTKAGRYSAPRDRGCRGSWVSQAGRSRAASGEAPGHVTHVPKAYHRPPCSLHLFNHARPSRVTFLKQLWPCAYLLETSLGFSAAFRRKARLP